MILLNRAVNWALVKMGKEKVSVSKKIKAGVKKAVKYISDFESIAAKHAVEQDYDYVICGHIHQPANRTINVEGKSVHYLNSGDWVENLTSLEYANGVWKIFEYKNMQIKGDLPLPKRVLYSTYTESSHVFAVLNTGTK